MFSSVPPRDPVACGVFVLLAFTLAGVAQTAWFRSPASHAFAWPLDGGLTLRGQRLLGANKTIRGFVVMIPAAALSFALLGAIVPASFGVWDLSVPSFAALGACAGFGFMAGELPNSFVKRQLGIAPGDAPFRSARNDFPVRRGSPRLRRRHARRTQPDRAGTRGTPGWSCS